MHLVFIGKDLSQQTLLPLLNNATTLLPSATLEGDVKELETFFQKSEYFDPLEVFAGVVRFKLAGPNSFV